MTHGGGILGDHVCEINHGSGNTGKLDISRLSGFESAAKRIVFNGRLIDLSGCIWRSRFTFSMVTSVDRPLGCKALDNIFSHFCPGPQIHSRESSQRKCSGDL